MEVGKTEKLRRLVIAFTRTYSGLPLMTVRRTLQFLEMMKFESFQGF